jgi:hypothetical protein
MAGYFEEFIVHEPDRFPKCLGIKIQEENHDGRALGYAGRREFVVDHPLTLVKGHRTVVYNYSSRRPVTVRTMLQRLEGRRD